MRCLLVLVYSFAASCAAISRLPASSVPFLSAVGLMRYRQHPNQARASSRMWGPVPTQTSRSADSCPGTIRGVAVSLRNKEETGVPASSLFLRDTKSYSAKAISRRLNNQRFPAYPSFTVRVQRFPGETPMDCEKSPLSYLLLSGNINEILNYLYYRKYRFKCQAST